MLKGLKRITYLVENLESAKQWYGKILNAQPVFETPLAAIFSIGGGSMSLVKGTPPLPARDGRIDVYWDVDDIETVYRELLASGATPLEPVKTLLNIKTAKVLDPFGNVLGITSMAAEARNLSVENAPSETALHVAFCRALAALDERKEIRGPDTLAHLFLPEERKKHLADQASRTNVIQKGISSPLFGYFTARTAWIDGLFNNALQNGVPQIVLLGAGYDTRAIRFKERLGNTRVFELDIQTTQQRKSRLLAEAAIEIPSRLSYVTIDFRTDDIGAVLEKAGFDKSRAAFFIWEGVSYYLAPESIDATLRSVRACCAPDSAICFDYMTERLESVNAGEPFLFWIRPEEIGTFLAEHGFSMIEHVDSREMEKRYLTLRNGALAERAMTRFMFALARAA
jgi:methyltransferase (TIGR00027 family)